MLRRDEGPDGGSVDGGDAVVATRELRGMLRPHGSRAWVMCFYVPSDDYAIDTSVIPVGSLVLSHS
jgi:hypothetical protein